MVAHDDLWGKDLQMPSPQMTIQIGMLKSLMLGMVFPSHDQTNDMQRCTSSQSAACLNEEVQTLMVLQRCGVYFQDNIYNGF